MTDLNIRTATRGDIDALLALEQASFDTDRLSRRSFHHFIKPGPHHLLVAETEQALVGYVLLLFRTGTSLARIYSIAVDPDRRGRGHARQLLIAAEQDARDHHCVFIRLEVRTDNDSAIRLYRGLGFHDHTQIDDYYEDGCAALQLEKPIHAVDEGPATLRDYYAQTTDFTCGPASLMMAMSELSPDYEPSNREELQIWREATTIFMTSGHGGCSPHGLALSAWRRGFDCILYINTEEIPFLDSVRGPQKKAILEKVHEDFLEQLASTSVEIRAQQLNARDIKSILQAGAPIVALVSTWSLNRNKAPHWVYVLGADEQLVYINDPDTTDDPWQSSGDYMRVPIHIDNFIRMSSFGQKRLRALLQLSVRQPRNIAS